MISDEVYSQFGYCDQVTFIFDTLPITYLSSEVTRYGRRQDTLSTKRLTVVGGLHRNVLLKENSHNGLGHLNSEIQRLAYGVQN